MSNPRLLLAYGEVIADLEQDIGWDENAKETILDALVHRIWELTEVNGNDNNE
jgi:hypothetical protein